MDDGMAAGNVAINGDEEYEGGNLLVVADKKVRVVSRKVGCTRHGAAVAKYAEALTVGVSICGLSQTGVYVWMYVCVDCTLRNEWRRK